jgi:PAS domain-containing protein
MDHDHSFYSEILDAKPMPVLIVDDDARIILANQAARPFLGAGAEAVYRRRTGEVLHCLRASDDPAGCGGGPACKACVIRNSVVASHQGQRVVRRAARMVL